MVDLRGGHSFFNKKNHPGDLKDLPFKMVADTDGFLVQPTNQRVGFPLQGGL